MGQRGPGRGVGLSSTLGKLGACALAMLWLVAGCNRPDSSDVAESYDSGIGVDAALPDGLDAAEASADVPSLPDEVPAPADASGTDSGPACVAEPPFVVCVDGVAEFVQTCRDGWCSIPAGDFGMGIPETSQWAVNHPDNAYHQVTITRPYLVRQTEMTVSEFLALVGPVDYLELGFDCSQPDPRDCPAVVHWNDAIRAANALSQQEGLPPCYLDLGVPACTLGDSPWDVSVAAPSSKVSDCLGYRLPTAAEWERAARAGSDTDVFLGDVDNVAFAGCDAWDPLADRIAWYGCNSDDLFHPVGSLEANPWGLHDVAGNAWEHVWDWWSKLSDGLPTSVDPQGPAEQQTCERACKGGDRFLAPSGLLHGDHGSSFEYNGIRLVRTLHTALE